MLGGPQTLLDGMGYTQVYSSVFGFKEVGSEGGGDQCDDETASIPLTVTVSGTTDSGCYQPYCDTPHWANGEYIRDGSSNGRPMWTHIDRVTPKLRWEGGTWLICGGLGCPNDPVTGGCVKSYCFAQTQSSAQLPPKLWGGATLTYTCGQPPYCDYIATLRAANDCLLFNSDNLMKQGKTGWGSSSNVAYVLNPKTMAADPEHPRFFLEPGERQGPLGTTTAWFHILSRHEQIWVDDAPNSDYSIAVRAMLFSVL